MLTYNDFQARTARASLFQFRGSNLKEIDDALKAYWADANTQSPHKVALLIDIVKACATWFKRKQGKSDNKSPGVSNDLFIRRKIAIRGLGEVALAELNTALNSAPLVTPQQKFAAQFHKNKLNTLTKAPTPVKSMAPGFQPERSTYLASKKKKAISGTGVLVLYSEVNDVGPGTNKQYQDTPATGAAKRALKKTSVDLLTAADFMALDEYASKFPNMRSKVIYTKKEDRERLLVFVNAGLLCDVNNAPITTEGRSAAYAMDRYGNLFYQHNAINKEITAERKGLIKTLGTNAPKIYFNHSSFNAGNDVICAGEIVISNGVLRYIDNRSGHYQPNRDNLHNCVQVLQQEGVDLRRAVVSVAEKRGATLESFDYNATTFLQNKTAMPDWNGNL